MYITDDESLAVAVNRMKKAGTDLADYEVKAAAGGFPKNIPDTISAFANTCGGTIILGVSEKEGFAPVPNSDTKVLQSKMAQAARELVEPPQAIEVLVLQLEGKPVIVANVREAPVREKPCYVRRLGQMGGSFIRTGDGDHKMSLYEIDRFIENQHRSARHDATVMPDASLSDFDSELLDGWLARVRETTLDRTGVLSDEELMENRRVASTDSEGVLRPTLAGIMALGKYPQKFFPRLDVVFTSYPNPRKGEVDEIGRRFVDSVNVDGPIPQMVVETVRAVSRNMKHGAIVKGALRENVPDYPLPAVREAVANALMHRDYSIDSQGTPVLVDMYPDRLEISNPGGLFGSLTLDRLGKKGGTASRNQFLARMLEDVPYTDYDGSVGRVVENRGSGIPTINRELEDALMESPIVRSTLDEFNITFRHRRMTEAEGAGYTRDHVEAAVLAYFAERESASTSEVAKASGMSTKTALRYIKALLNEGLLEPIGTKNSPKRRYRMS
ncbi:MAG: putative DNA binding domain-containing protein [Coriobacteriaceae bacterium]|nr:putative DNA binding domain-containing protein [Coriobacteriaceae bacterium]